MRDRPRVCIFGAGAIGAYIGAEFWRAGIDVSLVARGAHLAAMRANGLRLLIEGTEHVARPPCTDAPSELGVQDYVIIGLKAHQIPGAVEAMPPLLGPQTSVVTASNGLPYWFFKAATGDSAAMSLEAIDPGGMQARLLGCARALGCVVYPATSLVAPGVVRHEHGRKFPIGEPGGASTERIEELHRLFERAGFDAPIRDDIRDEIWLKLWGNLCFNPISALTGATVDVIAANPDTRGLCEAMMAEAKAVGEHVGMKLRVDAGRRIEGIAALGPHKMSMLQDLEQGRSLEIEPMTGVVQEIGRRVGQPTPTIDAVLALIRQRARAIRER